MTLLFLLFSFVVLYPFQGSYHFCYGDRKKGEWPDWDTYEDNMGRDLLGATGVTGPDLYPSSRFAGAAFFADGKFWIFGGNGFDDERDDRFDTGIAPQNDVWSYNFVQWTMLNGVLGRCNNLNSGTVKKDGGVHRMWTEATCGDTVCVNPGGKESFAYDVFDDDSTLIVFGGYSAVGLGSLGLSRLNDVWRYDIGNNLWTLDTTNYAGETTTNPPMVCDDLSLACNYSSANNRPKGRMEPTGKLILDNTHFIVFGGKFGVDLELTNELWDYTLGTQAWELLSGETSYAQASNRGDKVMGEYVYNDEAYPSARSLVYMWVLNKDTDPIVYIFGGLSVAPSSYWQDMWSWKMSTHQWKYCGGSEYIQQPTYITDGKKIFDEDNNPSSRSSGFAFLNPSDEETLMLFGGMGLDFEGLGRGLNDLWAFNTNLEEWMWVDGGTELDGDKDGDHGILPGHHSGYYAIDATDRYNPVMYVMGGFSSTNMEYCDDQSYEMGMIVDLWSFEFEDKCNSSYTFEYNSCNFKGECLYNVTNTYCECIDIYSGSNCENQKKSCYGMLETNPEVCNDERGFCYELNWCVCTTEYYFGIDCEENIGGEGKTADLIEEYNRILIPYSVSRGWVLDKDDFYLTDEVNGTFDCALTITNDPSFWGRDTGGVCSFYFGATSYYSTNLIVSLGTNYTAEPGDVIHMKAIYPPAQDPLQETDISIKKVAVPVNDDDDPPPSDDDGTITAGETTVIITGTVISLLAAFLVPMFCCLCCCCCCGCLCMCCIFCGMTCFATLIAYLKKRVSRYKGIITDNLDVLLLEQDDMFDKNFKNVRFRKKMFNIKFNSLDVDSVIASGGSNSVVYKVKWKGKHRALKLYKTKDLATQESFDAFADEVSIMQGIEHPNMLKFHGCTLDEPRVGIVIEYCANGDLRQYISSLDNPRFSTGDKLRILLEIADIMSFLNSLKIVHRDLKSDNVLLTDELVCKLIDFGLSKVVQNSSAQAYMTKQAGTSQYMAPEVTLSSDYGAKCDVFSYAIMIYEIMTEDFEPYGKFPEFNIELKVALNPDFRPKIEDRMVHKRPQVEWLFDMMRSSWDSDPEDRPTFEDIKELIAENKDETAEGMKDFDEMILARIEEQRQMRMKLKRKEEDIDDGEKKKN